MTSRLRAANLNVLLTRMATVSSGVALNDLRLSSPARRRDFIRVLPTGRGIPEGYRDVLTAPVAFFVCCKHTSLSDLFVRFQSACTPRILAF